jgi:hypothetical protein
MLSHHGAGALEAPAIVGNNDIVRPTDSPVASTNSFSCPVPSVQPSLVEIEHVSTSPDTATNPDSNSHQPTSSDPLRRNTQFTVRPQ